MASIIPEQYYRLLASLDELEQEALAKKVDLFTSVEYATKKKMFEYADRRADYNRASQYIAEVIDIGKKRIDAGKETPEKFFEYINKIKDKQKNIEDIIEGIGRDDNPKRALSLIFLNEYGNIKGAKEQVEQVIQLAKTESAFPEQMVLINEALNEFENTVDKFQETRKRVFAKSSKIFINQLDQGVAILFFWWIACMLIGAFIKPYESQWRFLLGFLPTFLSLALPIVFSSLELMEWATIPQWLMNTLMSITMILFVLGHFFSVSNLLMIVGTVYLGFFLCRYLWFKTHEVKVELRFLWIGRQEFLHVSISDFKNIQDPIRMWVKRR